MLPTNIRQGWRYIATDIDKHACIKQFRLNYSCKKFYCTCGGLAAFPMVFLYLSRAAELIIENTGTNNGGSSDVWHCGYSQELLRSFYDHVMIILWSSLQSYNDNLLINSSIIYRMIILLSNYDYLTIILWSSYDHIKIILWSSYHHLTIILWSSYDHLTIILRSSYDHLMIILQSYNDNLIINSSITLGS